MFPKLYLSRIGSEGIFILRSKLDGLGEYSDDADREDEGEGGVVGKGGGGGRTEIIHLGFKLHVMIAAACPAAVT